MSGIKDVREQGHLGCPVVGMNRAIRIVKEHGVELLAVS
jgi:hypothetical protein